MTNLRAEFLLALSFMTRLPLSLGEASDDTMARAPRLYPWVGLGIGACLGLSYLLFTTLFPSTLAVILTVAVGIALTGALHEDGLADTADGLGGGWTKERALEIMRDSRVGVYGILALGVALAIKIAALAALPTWAAVSAFIAAHTLGRSAITQLLKNLRYARTSGAADALGKSELVFDATPWAAAAAALVIVALLANLLAAFAAALMTAIAVDRFVRFLRKKIDGYTGDTLGAIEQIVETAVPVVILACL